MINDCNTQTLNECNITGGLPWVSGGLCNDHQQAEARINEKSGHPPADTSEFHVWWDLLRASRYYSASWFTWDPERIFVHPDARSSCAVYGINHKKRYVSRPIYPI